jgi:hypothetical protein
MSLLRNNLSLPLQLLSCALLSLGCFFLLTPDAFAQGFAGGGGINISVFYCSGGKGVGSLFGIFNQCPSTLTTQNIFSFLTCNIERLATDLFGDLYCGIIRELEPAIRAVLTLAVVFFGVGFTIGIIPATARDFMVFLLKIVFVYVFATQSDYMIGTAYRFLVTGSQEGIAIVVTSLFEQKNALAPLVVNGGNVFAFIDQALASMINLPTSGEGADVAAGQDPCKNAVFAAIALMAVAFPPLFFMAVIMVAKILLVFIRAIFGYLFSLIGLAFLMLLSPIFLSFSLFKITQKLFDKWIGYLASFSLQMVIVFAFMAFIFSLPVQNLTRSFFDIIKYNKTTVETNTWRAPWEYCTICDFEVRKVDPDTGAVGDVYGENEAVSPAHSRLVCKEPLCPLNPLTVMTPQNAGDPGTACAAGTATTNAGQVNNSQRIQNNILTFMMSGLLSLLILAYIVDQILTYTPMIARTLSNSIGGATYAPQIGGGYSTSGRAVVELPFESAMRASADAFESNYTYNLDAAGRPTGLRNDNTITRSTAAFGAAASAFLMGNGRNAGVVDGALGWILNPTRGAEQDDPDAVYVPPATTTRTENTRDTSNAGGNRDRAGDSAPSNTLTPDQRTARVEAITQKAQTRGGDRLERARTEAGVASLENASATELDRIEEILDRE